MQSEEIKIKTLIKRYVDLRYANYKNPTRLLNEATDRVQRDYIMLTGHEIENNPEVKRLLKEKDKQLNY